MSIRRILARIDGTDGDQAVLDTALAVARRFDAHIDAMHIAFDARDLPLVTGFGAATDLAMLVETMERTAAQSRARALASFEAWRQAAAIPVASAPAGARPSTAWLEAEGPEPAAIARLGRLADLAIIAQPADRNGLASMPALEAAIFETRRPVLMVPAAPGARPAAAAAYHRLERQRGGRAGGRRRPAAAGAGGGRRRHLRRGGPEAGRQRGRARRLSRLARHRRRAGRSRRAPGGSGRGAAVAG